MSETAIVGSALARDAALAQTYEESFGSCLAGMTGDNDHLLPAPRFQVRDYAPDHARWEVLWRCGHAPMWDVPSLTTRLIRETAACARSQ